MLTLKILGSIDIISAIVLLMLIFGIPIISSFLVFCAVLLLFKGMFVFGGDILSIVDLFSAIILLFSLFLPVFTSLLWICVLLLFAKGFVSFL